MTRKLLLPLIAALALALALVGATQTQAMSGPKLNGVTGPKDAFTITLKDAKGHAVKTLTAGTYTFVIKDGSAIHSFALDGPNKFAKDLTSIPFKGTKTVTLTLKKGKYKYYCANHESEMFGFFTVK